MSLFRWRTGLLALGTGLLLVGCQGVQPGKSPTVEFVVADFGQERLLTSD